MSETPELDYLNALQCQNNNLVRENLALKRAIQNTLDTGMDRYIKEVTATQPEESAEESRKQ